MNGPDCTWARLALDRRFDGEPPPRGDAERLAAHLRDCGSCVRLQAELEEVQRRLRAMSPQRLPDAALEAVWDRTTRSAGAAPVRTWRAAAAAAVLVVALGGLMWRATVPPAGPSEGELRRAADDTRLVLELAAYAMQRTERVAMHDVLRGDVSGALRRVPIDWPVAAGAAGDDDWSER